MEKLPKYTRIIGPLEKRFWAKVDKRSNEECWSWLGYTEKTGYGVIRIDNKTKDMAHRVSFRIHKGEFPKKAFICHSCDNPPCVNPSHLWIGDATKNNIDKTFKGRAVKKLTVEKVLEIKKRLSKGERQQSIADDFGIMQNTVSRIGSGARRKYVD